MTCDKYAKCNFTICQLDTHGNVLKALMSLFVVFRRLVSIFVKLVVISSVNFSFAFVNLFNKSLLSLLFQDHKTFHIEEPRRTQQI